MHTTDKIAKTVGFAATLLLLYYIDRQPVVGHTWTPITDSGLQDGQKERSAADVFSPDFSKERPTVTNVNGTSRPGRNRRSGRSRVPPPGKVYVKIGVTLGRGRPAKEAELKDSRIEKAWGKCLEWQGKDCVRREDMVVERISNSTPITDGTPVQMMIEYLAQEDAAGTRQLFKHIGYLYVINYVQYQDTTTSTPRLIYPTRQSFRGDNIVLPGKPVMLPDPESLWQITRNKIAAQKFETYIIIVSPEPLKDSNGRELRSDNLGETPMPLDEKLVAAWVRTWGRGVGRSDLGESLGRLFTRREQLACGNPGMATRDTVPMDTDLTPADPRPQAGFYKAVAPGGNMLITIQLPFSDITSPIAPKQ